MIFLLSPSKSMDMTNARFQKIDFSDKTIEIVENIKKLDIDSLGTLMKINSKLKDHTYNSYQNFDLNKSKNAINAYNGFVFKEIKTDEYIDSSISFMNEHFFILSALYGIVNAKDPIKEYRLDFTMKLPFNKTLYSYWKSYVNEYLEKVITSKKDNLIINLSSNEFSKLLDRKNSIFNIIDIEFKDKKNGVYKNIPTYSKKARGIFSHSIIQNKFSTLDCLKSFSLEGYLLNEELSSNNKLVFTRET